MRDARARPLARRTDAALHHGLGQSLRLAAVHAFEENESQEGRHLVVGDDAARVAAHDVLNLGVGQRVAVALLL